MAGHQNIRKEMFGLFKMTPTNYFHSESTPKSKPIEHVMRMH